jgi:XTP/dITP diphosphohydrolase
MSRQFTNQKILIASNNPGKIKEISTLFVPYGIEVVSASDLKVKEPEETGTTFSENAILKARYYGEIANLPALADDSGLSIDELDGFPGVYSARFAGENRDFTEAFKMIEEKLSEKGLASSSAFFTCALALWWPDQHMEIFEGKIEGSIAFPAIGDQGFGYAPIFIPKGESRRFSQMEDWEKNQISHRAKAFNKLIQACFNG